MTNANENWLEGSDVVPMFPTLVWKLRLKPEFHLGMDARLLAALEAQGLPRSAQSGAGWQSAQNLHELDAFADFKRCIERAVRGVVRFLRIGCDEFEITGCWATALARGASHRVHSHPNNFLSGVYYLRTPPGADTINFHDPRVQSGIIRPPVTELTAENTDQVVIRVEPGTLLLFPSYLAHSVDASAAEEQRLSISFNVMFSRFDEILSRPLW